MVHQPTAPFFVDIQTTDTDQIYHVVLNNITSQFNCLTKDRNMDLDLNLFGIDSTQSNIFQY